MTIVKRGLELLEDEFERHLHTLTSYTAPSLVLMM